MKNIYFAVDTCLPSSTWSLFIICLHISLGFV
jgi:hypothetical protein